jgi:hypothetical protein
VGEITVEEYMAAINEPQSLSIAVDFSQGKGVQP